MTDCLNGHPNLPIEKKRVYCVLSIGLHSECLSTIFFYFFEVLKPLLRGAQGVTYPRISLPQFGGFIGIVRMVFIRFAIALYEEIDVDVTFAQRRNAYTCRADAVIEIASEVARVERRTAMNNSRWY